MSAEARSKKASVWERAALAGILLFSVGLNFYRLAQEGYANLYYAAAVKSMLMSWHNFFFVSFDPGGFVSVDKPPLGLWLQALSAWIFGFHGWALLLPQALAGTLSVGLVYVLVRRVFGPAAGLIAALVLASTPILVAANRNNTMDSQLLLTCLLAAWAVSRATEEGRLRWLLLCAAFLGIGFNIKMLQAFLVLPACFGLFLVAARLPWWKRLAHLSLAALLTLAISLSWAVIVDLTPPDRRPYVGSSQNNTVMELIIGHNGAARLGQLAGLIGLEPRGPFGRPAPAQRPPQPPPGAPSSRPPLNPPAGNIRPGPNPPPGQYPGTVQPNQPPANQPNRLGDETGTPGPLRLLNRQLAGQISWLLPLALLGIFVAAWQKRLTWPLAPQHQQVLFWALWLLPQIVFFSYAGLFHRYYLSMMAPAVAALTAAGLTGLWADFQSAFSGATLSTWNKLRSWLLPITLAGLGVFQASLLRPFSDWSRWLTPLVVGLSVGAALLLLSFRLLRFRLSLPLSRAALALGLIALLISPTVWAAIPVWYGGDSGLPFAGPDVIRSERRGRSADTLTVTPLMQYLLEHWESESYLVATLNANTAAPIILSTGAPVMALGGFSGSDRILTVSELSEWVAQGYVRYFLLPAPMNLPGQPPPTVNPPGQIPNPPSMPRPSVPPQPTIPAARDPQFELINWVSRTCRVVPPAQSGTLHQNSGPQQLLLWDCRPNQ